MAAPPSPTDHSHGVHDAGGLSPGAGATEVAHDPTAGDDRYDAGFFTAIDPESYASARVVVPRVLGLTGARSIIDVGCGSGAWIRACRDVGVPEVVGVDGAYVPAAHREVATEFIECDLARPLELDRRFNLVICVEVAEHLAPERAPGLVADLTALAPLVLFSAAVPGQGGTGHVNEQWSEYWVALFEAHGWTCRDAVRPWVRTNEQVAWWYRQNLFLAVAPSADGAYASFPKLDSIRIPNPVDYLRRPDGDVMVPPGAAPVGAATEPDEVAATATGPASAGEAADTAAEAPPAAGASDAPGTAPSPSDDAPPPSDDAEPPADGDAGDEASSEAGDTAETAGAAGDRARRDADNAEFWGTGAPGVPTAADEADHPKPPGWEALKRMSRRVRRRGGS